MSPEVTQELCDERHRNLSEDVKEIKRDVKAMHKLLVGNGEPGVFERVRNLEADRDVALKITRMVMTNPKVWKVIAAVLAALGIGGSVGALWQ